MSEEANENIHVHSQTENNKEDIEKSIDNLKIILDLLKNKLDGVSIPLDKTEYISGLLDFLEESFSSLYQVLRDFNKQPDSNKLELKVFISDSMKIIGEIDSVSSFQAALGKMVFLVSTYLNNSLKDLKIEEYSNYKSEAEAVIEDLKLAKKDLEYKINRVDIISDDLRNKKVNEIFEDDSVKFKNLAKKYEIAFYLTLILLFLYFFGWYIQIDTSFLKFKFAEQFHGNHSATFYVQKISLLILSTTLAAFLLKRSFMNRRLADEAYRTAKELDALPRYMEGMPDEMKEKIRFDLAYKYFGNGIHHDSYTDGENLMHENIKANTEFMKIVKGVPSTTDESKADKDKNE